MTQFEDIGAGVGLLFEECGEWMRHERRRHIRHDEAAARHRADEAVRLQPNKRLRSDGRETLSCSARSRSAGRRWPGRSVPFEISSRICPDTTSDKRTRA